MASLWRVAVRQGCKVLQNRAAVRHRIAQPACLISTSKKTKDAATINESIQTKAQARDDEDDPVSEGHHDVYYYYYVLDQY